MNARGHTAIVVSFVCLIVFLLIALLRVNFTGLNNEVNIWATTNHTDILTATAKLVAYSFDTTPLLIFSIIIGTILFFMKKRRSGLLLVGAMVGNVLILEIIKTFIYSPRPMNELVLETGNSFPSGHVTSTVVLFGLFILFSWQFLKNTLTKLATTSFFAVIILFVGFTRIYLNVHWFSDVIGGYFLGAFWITFCIAIAPRIINIYKRLIVKN